MSHIKQLLHPDHREERAGGSWERQKSERRRGKRRRGSGMKSGVGHQKLEISIKLILASGCSGNIRAPNSKRWNQGNRSTVQTEKQKRWGEIQQNKSLVWPTNIKQENWEKNQKEAGRYLETLEQDGSFPHTWREKKTGLVEGETLDALLTAAPHQTLQSMSLLKPNESGEEAPPRNGNLWAEGGFKSQQKIQVCSWKLLQNNVKDWLW